MCDLITRVIPKGFLQKHITSQAEGMKEKGGEIQGIEQEAMRMLL